MNDIFSNSIGTFPLAVILPVAARLSSQKEENVPFGAD